MKKTLVIRMENTKNQSIGNKLYAFLSVVLMAVLMVGCDSNKDESFSEVTIGKQVWMSENLNVDKFRNGDPIPEAKTSEEWIQACKNKQPVWCYYEFGDSLKPRDRDFKSYADTASIEKLGKFYNQYALTDSRGLAPEGWHIPSNEEWRVLLEHLGGVPTPTLERRSIYEGGAVEKMRTKEGWIRTRGVVNNGTNESGFSGFPCGLCSNGATHRFGEAVVFWSSTENSQTTSASIVVLSSGVEIYQDLPFSDFGACVRFIRD